MSWSVEQHLPQSQVFALLEDRRGQLWAGTQGGGLCRFDGAVFTEIPGSDGFVFALFESANGDIWVGGIGSIARFDGQNWRYYNLDAGHIWAIQEFQGQMYAGTDGGLWQLDDAGFRAVTAVHWAAIYALHVTADQSFLLGTQRGLFRWQNNKPVAVTAQLSGPSIQSIRSDDRGRVWMAVFGKGVGLLDHDSVQIYSTAAGLPNNRILDVLPTPDGSCWIATQDAGVGRLRVWSAAGVYEPVPGAPSTHVHCLLRDSWGNIWLGTSGGGLARWLGGQFSHYDQQNGLPGNSIYAISPRKAGGLWLAVADQGVVAIDSSGVHILVNNLQIKCKAVAEDLLGRVWIGTEGRGLALVRGDSLRFLTASNGLPSDWIRALKCDASGRVWVATHTGIGRITTRPDSTFFIENLNIRGSMLSLWLDRNNQLWFGTNEGRVGVLNTATGEHRWLETECVGAINAFAEDSDGHIWFVAQGVGIMRVSGEPKKGKYSVQPLVLPVATTAAANRSLYAYNIYALVADQNGQLWAGTANGVDRLELNTKGEIVNIRHFGRAEGFKGIESCRGAAYCDAGGQLWFGTVNGITRGSANASAIEFAAPKIQISAVNLFYQPLEKTPYSAYCSAWGGLRSGLVLPYDQNNLGFELSATHLSHPEGIRYQWLLEPNDRDWSPPTDQAQVAFANLPPGTYRLRVRACLENGEICAETTTPEWQIAPPFWQTWWFRLTAALGLLAGLASLFWLRILQERKKAAIERERLETANRLLRVEQQARQLQMNPHFIFNCLNSIQALVATGDSALARRQLTQFARLMRSILDNSRAETITLEQEIATLEQYLVLEQSSRDNHFEFDIQVNAALDVEAIRLPPMLLQPFVENAILHGVAHLPAGKGRILVCFEPSGTEQGWKVTIEDNGVGRTQSAILKRKTTHSSVATDITRERLALLQTNHTASLLDIEDLFDRAGHPAGTRVCLSMHEV